MQRTLSKVFGTGNDRVIKRIVPIVEQIGGLGSEYSKLSDAQLKAKTPAFRQRLENGESLDDLLPEAFAAVREATKRTLGMRHHDVQLIGGVVLHRGWIAEMKTGEGKTLVAPLPAYLTGLTGKGVHIVTVNDYLAKRDAEWMGQIHRFLGLSVGHIIHGISDVERRAAYDSDIAYCTNNELGFDYLRDNMKFDVSSCVQRDLNYVIVDEVDSVLIDEARTPLIISGQSEENVQLYAVVNRVIPKLKEGAKGEPAKGIEETGDYYLDEKHHSATLTEAGIHKVEKMLSVENLYEPSMLPVLHGVSQALIAHTLKRCDVDYVIDVGERGRKEVVIVDEHTGRKMPGRRWSDGLHQAVEAKEGITVQSENQTLASVTFQNFFRMYDRISGMTGTADTEAEEFAKIYDLDVMIVPTNRPMIRDDMRDVVFKTKKEKFDAAIEDIKERHEKGQPILVGTISIETSEMLSSKLKKRGLKHNVLNAKHHEREAEIVAQAGRQSAVTISTNMAGRGTDIVLGGNAEVLALAKCQGDREHADYLSWKAKFEDQCRGEREKILEAGGLHILGTERHESRRIDNQLRGRSGRQGDPGSSQFHLSLEDDLLRIFEADRVAQWWDRVGVEEGEAIENKMLTRVIEGAQKKVEARNFGIRKHLLEYDDVPNKQRQAFYGRRRHALDADSVHEEVLEMTEGVLVSILDMNWPEKGDPDREVLGEIVQDLERSFGVNFAIDQPPFDTIQSKDELGREVCDRLFAHLDDKAAKCNEMAAQHAEIGYPGFHWFERDILLQILDGQWKDHLHTMDGLREGIGLRGYAQKDPKVEFQREGWAIFETLEGRIDEQAVELIFKFVLPEPRAAAPRPRKQPMAEGGAIERQPRTGADAGGSAVEKVGRNAPCPCGSGKKYKRCHGAA
ncbi:MAG: preprotein translocase subunit SecA [Myxococcota bacterium]|nr:preprotein translocase subunit SecA [Myxococcota bacterium]